MRLGSAFLTASVLVAAAAYAVLNTGSLKGALDALLAGRIALTPATDVLHTDAVPASLYLSSQDVLTPFTGRGSELSFRVGRQGAPVAVFKPSQLEHCEAWSGDVIAHALDQALQLNYTPVAISAVVPMHDLQLAIASARPALQQRLQALCAGGEEAAVGALVAWVDGVDTTAPAHCGADLSAECAAPALWADVAVFDFLQGHTLRHAWAAMQRTPAGQLLLQDHHDGDLALNYTALPVFQEQRTYYWQIQVQVAHVRRTRVLREACLVSHAMLQRLRPFSQPEWSRWLRQTYSVGSELGSGLVANFQPPPAAPMPLAEAVNARLLQLRARDGAPVVQLDAEQQMRLQLRLEYLLHYVEVCVQERGVTRVLV